MYRMSAPVNRRPYDSSRRQEQARRNRAHILDAARDAFLARGYAATTIPDVAARAGVSVETVYKAFRNKPGLLKAVFDVAVAGDDEPVPIMQRDFVAQINAEPDPATKLRMYAQHLHRTMPRTSGVLLLARAAATMDDDIAAVWQQMNGERLIGMTAFATHLHDSRSLRRGITIEHARDVLWTYNAVEIYDLLVNERGWSVDRYRDFVADALVAALVA
jgi:AcrR family transcriptional regulator